MKHFLLVVVFLATLAVTPERGLAIVCSNCAQLKLQIPQLAKDTVTAGTSAITSVQQTLETVNNTILIPIRDALTIVTVLKSGNNMRNLILGTVGIDPLLVDNPERYLKGKALDTINASLAEAGLAYTPGNESVLENILTVTRYNSKGVSARIQLISQSPILPIIQKQVCADYALNKLAEEQVLVPGRPFDQAAFTAKKQELRDAFCVGDPMQNTPEGTRVAENLKRLQQARPEVGGWDSWLTMVSGDNPYTKNARIQQELQREVNAVVSRAEQDLALGGGIRSLTECKERALTNPAGQPYTNPNQAPCVQEVIKQAGSILNQTFKDAISGPIDLLKQSFGSGAGGLINTAFTTVNILTGISQALDNFNGSSSGGGGTVNTGSQSVSTGAITNDLQNNPTGKKTLTDTPREHLSMHTESLDKFETANNQYVLAIANYNGKLNSMRQCFVDLVREYPETSTQAEAAYSYYNETVAANAKLQEKATTSLALIAPTREIISTTETILNTSNSSDEISRAFDTYRETVSSKKLPDILSHVEREGEVLSFKAEVDQSEIEGGRIYDFNTACTSLRQQMQVRNAGGA